MKTEKEIKEELRVSKEALKFAVKAKAYCSAICQQKQIESFEWVLEKERGKN